MEKLPNATLAQQSNPATLREADLRQHIANLLRVYRTALRFIKTCHEQKAWPRDLLITEENSNVIERAEAALRQSAAPSGGAALWNAAKERERLALQIAEDLMAQNMLNVPCVNAFHLINARLFAQESQTGAVTETK